jgi:hypothetical protein
MKTKTYRLLGLTAVVLFSIAAFEARTQVFTLHFDENGNGSFDLRNGQGLQPDRGIMLPDPTQPGLFSLTYMLPVAGLVNGDVRVWEDPNMTLLSDWMRFTDANGNLGGVTADRMIYYSDVGDPDLADTGFPTGTFHFVDNGGIVEQPQPPVEGNNGFVWQPDGPNGITYIGISDVPEPVSFGLMLLGGLLGLRRLLWRKQS